MGEGEGVKVGVGGMGVKNDAGAIVGVGVAPATGGAMAAPVKVGAGAGVITVPQPLSSHTPRLSNRSTQNQQRDIPAFTSKDYTTPTLNLMRLRPVRPLRFYPLDAEIQKLLWEHARGV